MHPIIRMHTPLFKYSLREVVRCELANYDRITLYYLGYKLLSGSKVLKTIREFTLWSCSKRTKGNLSPIRSSTVPHFKGTTTIVSSSENRNGNIFLIKYFDCIGRSCSGPFDSHWQLNRQPAARCLQPCDTNGFFVCVSQLPLDTISFQFFSIHLDCNCSIQMWKRSVRREEGTSIWVS